MQVLKLEADLNPTFESIEQQAHNSPQSAFSRWFQPPSRVLHVPVVASWIKRALLILASTVLLGLVLNSTIYGLPSGKSIDHLRHSWLQVATMNATAGWTSLPSSKNSSSPCGWSPCLDEEIGARIINGEIAHMVNILNLLDGCGRQFGRMLDPDRE